MSQFLEEYDINLVKSSPYYSQGNGDAKATNKTLLLILSKMVYGETKQWAYFLYLVL